MTGEQTTNNEPLKHWTAQRLTALVLEILCGDTTAAEAARRHDLTVTEIIYCPPRQSDHQDDILSQQQTWRW